MIRIERGPLDEAAIARSVGDPACGAMATFAGVVRDENDGRSVEMVRYEAYEPMAIRKMQEIARLLQDRWKVRKVAIHHRLGDLQVGETSVILAVSSPHRKEAFEAVRWGMDLLKSTVPIWKREFFTGGGDAWVGLESRDQGTD